MSGLHRRLSRLEGSRPQSSRWDAMDPILAELSMPELIDLVQRGSNVERGIRPTPDQEAVYGLVSDRLAFAGIALA